MKIITITNQKGRDRKNLDYYEFGGISAHSMGLWLLNEKES
jgi:hypothetical protein